MFTRGLVELAPDWVREVLSPSSARLDRGDKRKIYQENAVGHLWLVDPFTGDLSVRAPPFEAVAIDLGALGSR